MWVSMDREFKDRLEITLDDDGDIVLYNGDRGLSGCVTIFLSIHEAEYVANRLLDIASKNPRL